MIEEHLKDLQWWTYLLRGIHEAHKKAWYSELLKTKGYDEAELFKRRVNYINKKQVLK